MIPVILSGGSGTRLWPLSREALSEAVPAAGRRRTPCCRRPGAGVEAVASAPPMWSATRSTASWSPSSCARSACTPSAILLEPVGAQHRAGDRGGGAAGGGRAAAIRAAGAAGRPRDRRRRGVPRGGRVADRRRAQGELVTFGIVPTGPETGYGYIRRAAARRRRRAHGRAVRREAGRRDRASAIVAVGRLLLEQRHVPVPRVGATSTSSSACAPTCSPRRRAAFAARQARRAISCAWTRTRSPPARAIRSTTR